MRRRFVYRPDHPRANERGFVDVDEIGWVEQGPQAINAPILVDRFMEGAQTADGVDIGSRLKRREYMKATGSADASDFSRGYFEKVRSARDNSVKESTRKTVAEVSKMDVRHLPKFIEEGKKR